MRPKAICPDDNKRVAVDESQRRFFYPSGNQAKGKLSLQDGVGPEQNNEGPVMLKLAIFFLIVSLIAGLFGFTGISAASAGIAKILFFLFIALFVLFLVIAVFVGKSVS